jgi:hypothetical protein
MKPTTDLTPQNQKKISVPAPPHSISVDVDERAFLFPETRLLTQIRYVALSDGGIELDFIYAHNESRLPPACIRLRYEDARDLCQRMVEAVYRAQSQNVISESIRIAIAVVANGYILNIEEGGMQKSLYISTHIVWRFCHALFRMVDFQSPVMSN